MAQPIVFDTEANGEASQTINLVVNGRQQSVTVENGQTLRDFVIEQASNAGIRTFSVYANSQAVDQAAADSPVSRFQTVEIVAKDSRG